MDIKDRLNIARISKPEVPYSAIKAPGEAEPVSALFDENETVLGIITEIINSGKNIVFVCPKDCNKKTTALLLKNYVRRNIPVAFPASDAEYAPKSVNFVPDASGRVLTDIMQAVLTGTYSFAVGLNLNSFDNLVEKIETLVALNSGLEEKYIKVLLREFAPVFISVTCENDLYTVKSIDKTVEKDGKIVTKNVYSFFSSVTEPDNKDNVSNAPELPDFKSILEETAAKKDEAVVNELILNNPALKNSTDKYSIAEMPVELKDDETKEIETPAETAKNEELQESVTTEASAEPKPDLPEEKSEDIIPSVRNILEEDIEEAVKEAVNEVVNSKPDEPESVISVESALTPEEKEEKSDKAEEIDENIDLNIPAQATPVNKYKALREKIRSRKEREQ